MKYSKMTVDDWAEEQDPQRDGPGRGRRRMPVYAETGGHGQGRGRGGPGGGGRGRGRAEGWRPDFGPGGPGGPWGFGGPFGPGGPGGRHGGRGGRGRRGDVRRAILALLAEGPANGYQIMSGIEEKSNGLWRPSPGSVYPALSLLEDEGLIEAVQVDGKKAYALTEAGRTHVAEHGEDTARPWDEVAGPRRGWLDVRAQARALMVTVQQVATTGTPEQREQAREVLDRARRDLHRIMAGDDIIGQ